MIAFLFYLLGKYRLKKGKEDPERFRERLGYASIPRPEGALVWFHAASVGETLSLVSFIEKSKELFPEITYLLTTTTMSGAKIAHQYLDCLHQYIPYDAPAYMKRFLNYWKPSKCFLVESELWPCLLLYTRCPIILLNARLSEKSYKRWKWFPWIGKSLIKRLHHVWAPSTKTLQRFQSLGARSCSVMQPLKLFARPLPYDSQELARLQNDRPKWLAVSTHPGEEEICLDVHTLYPHFSSCHPDDNQDPWIPDQARDDNEDYKKLQTWIALRHVDRVGDVETFVQKKGLTVCRYSDYRQDTDIVLIDCMGKMGLFYALCPTVLVGGSFGDVGGHNPIEPLLFGCQTLWGPNMKNFEDVLPFLPNDGSCKDAKDIASRLVFRHQEPFQPQTSLEELIICLILLCSPPSLQLPCL